jgi:hypothetical protein
LRGAIGGGSTNRSLRWQTNTPREAARDATLRAKLADLIRSPGGSYREPFFVYVPKN